MMSKNNIIFTAICGAVVATVVANFLGTEKGKQVLNSASGLLQNLVGKAADHAKDTIANQLETVE